MKISRIVLILILFIANLQCVIGQSGYFYSSDKYLSNSLINTIYQDSRSYIWIATEDGLNKFDGVRFSSYHADKANSSALKSNYVRTVFEDSKGRFWIGCINGLLLYNRDEDTFTEVPVYFHNKLVTPHITSIIETHDGEIWISTSGTGIIRSTDNYKTFNVDDNLFPKICSRYLIALYQENDNIWICSENHGLCKLNLKTDEILNYLSPSGIGSNQISSICGDKNGNIFAGTLTGGLYKYNSTLDKFTSIPYITPSITLPVKSLLIDRKNRLLIGTDGHGIKIYNKKTQCLEDFELTSAMFDFSKTKIHSLCEDKMGNLWLGLFQKGVFLSLHQPNNFKYFGSKSYHQNLIGSNCVMSVHRDNAGTVWVGTDNDGLYGITGHASRHFNLNSGTKGISGTIMSILEGNDDHTLWLASFFDGLLKFDKNSGKITRFENNSTELSKNTAANKAMSITRDSKNRIWVGTNGAGVQIFDIQKSKFVQEYLFHEEDSSGIANNWVNCVKRDGENMMWIGTYDGVSSVNILTNKIKTYRIRDGILPGNVVLAIAKDQSGQMWFGTTSGLARFQPATGRVKFYSVTDGLAGNVVCGIQEDKKGNIWISTHSGISKFIPASEKFINYYSYDGLQGNEFTTGAYFLGNNGEMLFGGIAGVTSFFPEQISEKITPVHIYLTGMYLPDKKVVKGMKSGWHTIIDNFISDAKKIRLSFDDNIFSLEFSTFDFGSPERVYYKYKIDGINNQWITTEKGANRISFTNLNYGDYRLRIKACVNNQESEIKVIDIDIYPPWYLSWLAKSVYFLLMIFIGWVVYRFITERIKNRHELMRREHLEQVNEGKLQFFINISHEIRTPMSLIISPLEKLISEDKNSEKQAVYHLMYRNAQRILRLINQLLDVRKIDKGQMFVKMRRADLVSFIDDLMKTFEYQAIKRNIDFKFEHETNELFVWIDINNFDKVLVNILSNAFKFTPEKGNISIEICTGNNENAMTPALRNFVEISVIDTGIGIKSDDIERIFERFYQIDNSQTQVNFGTGIGLHLAKNLVELMHGQIIAENNPDKIGSKFTIRLPLGDAHLLDSEKEYINNNNFQNNRVLTSDNFEFNIENKPSKQSERGKSRQRLLIVDDEEEIRNYLKEEFSGRYRVYEAENGKQALDFILNEKPDLVISDVMMPEMDGITLCKKLKSNINIHQIPIILLTAKSSDEDKAEGFDIGADAYVAKPFNIELLKKRVLNILENRARLEHKAMDDEENKALIKQVILKPNDQILLEKIIKIINENIADSELNVEMLADGVGMSRVHMHRKLKALTNMSARDFIRSIRMKQAADLLSMYKLTISEVAYALGYSNLSHFSNSFREYYGLSPKEYSLKNWNGN